MEGRGPAGRALSETSSGDPEQSPNEPNRLLGLPLSIVVVLVALELLWLRFNAAPGAPLKGDVFRMAAQGDLLAYYLPMMQHVAGRLASGELPLWNSGGCCGIPLLATLQIGTFYPGNLLAIVLPVEHAIPWMMFAECALAGFFAAWLFRAWGHSEPASALGGVVFLFACVFGQVLWPPVVSSLMWIPWILLAVEHVASSGSVRWWFGLVIGIAFQILAGFPQYLVYGFYIIGPFALVRLLDAGRPWRLRAIRGGALVCAGVLALGLTAVQLLPSLELAGESMRQSELTRTDLHYLTPWDPFTSGEMLVAALDPSPRFVSFNLGSGGGYLGIATLLLAVLGVVAGFRSRMVWLWLSLGALALVLSDGLMGWSAPFYRLYAELPVVGSFRTPERMRVIAFFCATALAVRGFDALSSGERRLRMPTVVTALVLAGAMIALGHGLGIWRVVAATVLMWMLLSTSLDAAQRRAAQLGLIGLVILDLVIATGEYGYLRSIPLDLSNRYASTDRRTVLPPGFYESERDAAGLGRIALYKYRPRIASSPSEGGYRISCYEPLVPAQWARLERALKAGSGMGATLYDLDYERYAPLYDVAGVTRILREPIEGTHEVELNEDALPRAYLVNAWRVVDQDQAFRHLRAGNIDFSAEVLLEREPLLEGRGFPWPEILPAEIVEYAPERVVIEAEAPSASLLVLSDTHYPGWRATVDGEPVEILRANGLYRAVALEQGSRRVVFEYVPDSLRLGGSVSLASIGVLGTLGAIVALRSRSSRAGSSAE
jgi:hypothetical protein